MEALAALKLPGGRNWRYEPRWDGFRAIAFRRGRKIEIQSKSLQPLARYFPDLIEALGEIGATRFTLDGELTIAVAGEWRADAF